MPKIAKGKGALSSPGGAPSHVLEGAGASGAIPSGKAKEKKSAFPVWAVFVVVLLAVVALFAVFLVPHYKYSFNINGVDFVSDEYTPVEFFGGFKASDKYAVFLDLPEGRNDDYLGNAARLWVIALMADLKSRGLEGGGEVVQVVRSVDSFLGVTACFTNDGNISVSRELSLEDCGALAADDTYYKVFVKLGGSNTALLSQKSLEISSQGRDVAGRVNYFVIQQAYPNFEELLLRAREIINALPDSGG